MAATGSALQSREVNERNAVNLLVGLRLAVGAASWAAPRAAGKLFPYSNHNPDFFVDLAAIPVGAKVDTVMALSILANNP